MTHLKKFSLFIFWVILAAGCTKPNVVDDPPDNPPPPPPSNGAKPNGTLYIAYNTEFYKVNTVDSAVLWSTRNVNSVGSAGYPMIFDSTTFYNGNHNGLTAYSTVTGIVRWTFFWLAFSNALSYREPAFKDSLVFLTSPTSEWDHAYLYCLNKKTGAKYWQKQIDQGYVSILFNSTPMVMGDNVIVLTRDANNHRHLTAYKIADETQQWTTGVNDSLSTRLRFVDGKIYSTSNQNAICYDAVDGSLKWQTALNLSSFDLTSTFFDQNKLVLVKVLGNQYTIITLNITDGSIIKRSTLTVPTEFQDPSYSTLGCNYYNNTLFIASRNNQDSVSLRSYDLSNLAMKWEKRFANNYYAPFAPLLSDKYLIFPINSSHPDAKSIMYFFDLDGKQITGIPFSAINTYAFAYTENGVTYKPDNIYVSLFEN